MLDGYSREQIGSALRDLALWAEANARDAAERLETRLENLAEAVEQSASDEQARQFLTEKLPGEDVWDAPIRQFHHLAQGVGGCHLVTLEVVEQHLEDS